MAHDIEKTRDKIGINTSTDQLVIHVAALDRAACKAELRACGSVKTDFTEEYLEALPLEKLRHLVLAACLHARKTPR